jgi:hypothetical protein
VQVSFSEHAGGKPLFSQTMAVLPRVGEYVALGAGMPPRMVTLVIHDLTGIQRVRVVVGKALPQPAARR